MEYLKKIKELRESKGFSQLQLAKAIGLTPTGYNLIESGKRGLDIERLKKIAEALSVNINYFLTDEKTIDYLEMNEIYEVLKLFKEDICLEVEWGLQGFYDDISKKNEELKNFIYFKLSENEIEKYFEIFPNNITNETIETLYPGKTLSELTKNEKLDLIYIDVHFQKELYLALENDSKKNRLIEIKKQIARDFKRFIKEHKGFNLLLKHKFISDERIDETINNIIFSIFPYLGNTIISKKTREKKNRETNT